MNIFPFNLLGSVAGYLKSHGFSKVDLERIGRSYDGQDLLVTGATGGLGLSLLSLLILSESQPKTITLVGKRNEVESHWKKFGEIKKIHITSETNDQIRNLKLRHPIIFHLAGYGQPARFITDTEALVYLNTEMIFDLLSLEPKSISYISTTEIYNGQGTSCDEKTPIVIQPQHPRSTYVFSKLLGESILSNSACQTGIFRVALATPLMFFDDDTRVLADLVRSAINEKRVVLRGGHHSVRSYQYGPFCIAKLLYTMSQTQGSFTVNLSGGQEITLETLGKKIASMFGVSYISNSDSEEIGAPSVVRIDSSKIETFLNKEFKSEKIDDLLKAYAYNVTTQKSA